MKENNVEKLRHSLAHLLAASILEIYPDAKPTLGPAIENGFYYDFDDLEISEKDLPKIEKQMKKLLPSWKEFTHKEISEKEALEIFKNNPYKLELIEEIKNKGEKITLYTAGKFTDLCRGGHVENPSKDINPDAFKLDRVAGAYWRGDEKNKMLTRVYGLAFNTKKELDEHIEQREEAQKRDHRKIGKELDLFTFSDLVGPGLPLFTPKGTLLRNLIIKTIGDIQEKFGFEQVTIPHITKKELYQTSGHWEKFKEELFHVKGKSDTEFVMKPMNCPHHTQIYASRPRSYKELPVRFAETTMVYRDEQAGELMGLARVRSISQDDAHVFCTLEQTEQEVRNIISVIREFYTALDLFREGNYWVSFSVRDPKTPEKYLGNDETWNKSESILESAAKKEKLNYKKMEGEAAFYGPKLDFMFKDSLGRERQLGTVQLDLNMPGRFGLEYTAEDGSKKTPIMIHRAVAGSLERFLVIAIEHFAGTFPFWLSPVQVKILPIGESHRKFAETIFKEFKTNGIRAELDQSDETLGKKVRNAKVEKVPYWIVLGDKEVKEEKMKIESRDGKDLGTLSLKEALETFKEENRIN